MFDYAEVFPIFGPPGTGKTTTCVEIVKKLIEDGVEPGQIAYVAFTKKAAFEAQERVASQLGIPKTGMTYFSTIHAMGNRAYKAEFPDSLRVMKAYDFEAVGDRVSMPVRAHWKITEDADFVSSGGVEYGSGDAALSQINLARARGITLEEQIKQFANLDDLRRFDCFPEDIIQFEQTLKSYKQAEGMFDFNDMLERTEACAPLPVRYAIIDEAQDLSAAQWRVCDSLMRNCKKVWIAGDDDQAIYRFSGADATTFLGMGKHDNARVLEQSYRLPEQVFHFANRIISNVSERVPKDWHTEKSKGKIQSVMIDHAMDKASRDGEWLLLVRNRGFMRAYETQLRAMTVPYLTDGRSSLSHAILVAIKAWEKVRTDKPITPTEAASIYKQMDTGVKRGFKTVLKRKLLEQGKEVCVFDDLIANGLAMGRDVPWFDALDDIDPKMMGYLRGVAKRGELFTKPRINLNTIHGVKGGEADNVVILPDMGRLTHTQFEQSPDDEHRCAYVAATRAKTNLYIVISHAKLQYPY